MTDFSKAVFEERMIGDGMREVRIVMPAGPRAAQPDVTRTGNEARKRLIRYVFANVSAMAPHLADECEAQAAAIHEAIDAEPS
jgi:hypothetical protein